MTDSTHSASTNPEWPLDAHILGRMDKLAALVATLDDDTFNATLPIPAINSLAVLLRHVTGSARYWLERASASVVTMSATATVSFLPIAVLRRGWRFTAVIARLLNRRWWSCGAWTVRVLLL